MEKTAQAREKIRWDSIDEVPERWRHLVPPVPSRAWTLDVPRDQLAQMAPHPDAEERVRAKLALAAEREKLSGRGVPLFMRFSDGSVVRCLTEEESRRVADRLSAFRAGTRGGGWDIDRVIHESRERDAAKLGAGRARAAEPAGIGERRGAG